MEEQAKTLLSIADNQIERLNVILNRLRSTKYNLVGLAEPGCSNKDEYPSSLESKLYVIAGLVGQIQDESASISSIVWSHGVESCPTNCAEVCSPRNR